MQVGDLIQTVYSDRIAIVTEVNPLPTWNTSPFGVKYTYIDGKPESVGNPDPWGMQPSDRIRIVSTSVPQPVHFIRDWDHGWWRGGLWK